MDGNIAKEGIRLDLDWMQRIGIAGFTVFQGSIDTPQVVPHRLGYMSPAWKDAFRFAVTSAHGRGMEVAIASSAGWSETGGPWVPPAEAMKKMVWSETHVSGGQPFKAKLAPPPDATGTFQNFSVSPRTMRQSDGTPAQMELPRFYADAAVIAYRTPPDEDVRQLHPPTITSNAREVDARRLSDGDINSIAFTAAGTTATDEAWLLFDYGSAQTIRSLTIAMSTDILRVFDQPVPPFAQLQASDDGTSFRWIANVLTSSVPQRTFSFDAVAARYFRVIFPAGKAADGTPVRHALTELMLHPSSRVNQFEQKAGFATTLNYDEIPEPKVLSGSIVSSGDVLDLTSKMQTDGTLSWMPPAGDWTVLRIGYSLTGHENSPAPAEATGLEVDKFNKTFVQRYLAHYLDSYAGTVGAQRMGERGIQMMLTDSIEAGSQNWTDAMLDEFKQRRGYDARPWLPTLTGVFVGSVAATDRFLWDFRQTLADLIAENHYGTIAEELHRRHMGYYGEALEYRRPSLGDDMAMRSWTDVPMGAMWAFPQGGSGNPTYPADLLGAASVAHIYGQNLVGAESLTASHDYWSYSPRNLKTVADLEFALGVNRFIIHESTHQPVIGKAPGLTLGRAGQFFSRNETWAEQAGPWIQYLARCSFLLQQGHYAADVAYFYGEEGPLTAAFGLHVVADAPQGYGFDFVNADVLQHHVTIVNGRMTTITGTSYKVLYLGGTSRRMTLPTLKRIRDLVSQGVVLVGDRPTDSPSLHDSQDEFQAIVTDLWGDDSSTGALGRMYKRGFVYRGSNMQTALSESGLSPDFSYDKGSPDTSILFLHRQTKDADLYFVSNRKPRAESTQARFRVANRIPELWDPADGTVHAVSYRIEGGHTIVPLHLDSDGSAFLVFRRKSTKSVVQLPPPVEEEVMQVSGDLNRGWEVAFQADRGAPPKMTFGKLISWSDSSVDGIRYFSGTATYTKTFAISPSSLRPNAHLWLDLGDARELVEVNVNGHAVGTLWKIPYRIDLGSALHAGNNTIQLKVTNLWVNRLIGDEQPATTRRYTFTDFRPYTATSPLLPSGVLGPIRLLSRSE